MATDTIDPKQISSLIKSLDTLNVNVIHLNDNITGFNSTTGRTLAKFGSISSTVKKEAPPARKMAAAVSPVAGPLQYPEREVRRAAALGAHHRRQRAEHLYLHDDVAGRL